MTCFSKLFLICLIFLTPIKNVFSGAMPEHDQKIERQKKQEKETREENFKPFEILKESKKKVKTNKKNNTPKKKEFFFKRVNTSLSYSNASDDAINGSNHLSSFGLGATAGFNFKNNFSLGLTTDLRLMNQYTSTSKVGENFRGFFWNYASLNLSKDVDDLNIGVDLHFFGEHKVYNKSNLGNDITYTNPIGAKVTILTSYPFALPDFLESNLNIGGSFEWISFGKINVGTQELDSSRKLWQLGINFTYDF